MICWYAVFCYVRFNKLIMRASILALLGLILVQSVLGGLTKIGLKDLEKVKVDDLTCDSPEFPAVRNALLQWGEALAMHQQGHLENDIKMLNEIKLLAKAGMEQHDDVTLIQERTSLDKMLEQKFKQLKLAQSKHNIGQQQCNELRNQIEQIMNSDDPDERRQCCSMLYGLIEYMIQQMEQLQQCCQTPIVININGQIEKLEIIGGDCQATPEVELPAVPRPKEKMPDVLVIPKEVGAVCVEGANEVTDSYFDREGSIIDTEIFGNDLQGVNQYGYGYWFKFTTHYPGKMYRGKTRDQYYMSRMTQNTEFKDLEMGDRTLMVFLGRNYFDFSTYDRKENKADVKMSLQYGDIEGQWQLIYFSYAPGRATSFLHYPGVAVPTKTKTVRVEHDQVKYLRFMVGGKDRKYHEGFNGQINKPILRIGKGSYVDNIPNFDKLILGCNPMPVLVFPPGNIDVIDAPEDFSGDEPVEPNPVPVEFKMPEEYSAGGWFKWSVPLKKKEWAIAYRVTIIDEDVLQDDVFLGDRDLTVFIQKSGTMRFATYSYFNLDGVGNPNIHKDVKNCYQPGEWHYIYTGYSRPLRKAIAYVICHNERNDLEFPQANHFLSQRQIVFVAKDPFYEQYPGQVAFFSVSSGEGSFDLQFNPKKERVPSPSPPQVVITPTPPQISPTPVEIEPTPPPTPVGVEPFSTPSVHEYPEETFEESVHVYEEEEETFEEVYVHTFENICIEGAADVIDASYNGPAVAEIDISENDLKDTSEYGFGFWLRFLTRYPEPLFEGLNQNSYFIARLTENIPYKNSDIGDRALAIFFTQNGYQLSTYDNNSNNGAVNTQVEYGDVEGVWTYIYYSYSQKESKAVGYVIYPRQDPVELTINAVHQTPKKLRLILAGAEGKSQPGFNGQFSRPVLRVGEGAYLANHDDLQQFARACNPPPPPDCNELKIVKYLEKKTKFKGEEPNGKPQYVESPADSKFPSTYSVQGWFKWQNGAAQQSWHSMFRLTANLPQDNQNAKRLGDRSLAAFLGSLAGGVITFSTYSYDGLKGQGNPNVHQSIPYHDQVTKWHYVYFLYEREHRSAFAEVTFKKGKVEQQFVDIHHFLTERQYLYIGRDQFYPSYIGYIARFKINMCGTKYNPEFLTPTPDIPITPPVEVPTEECQGITPYVEITADNIDLVIKAVEQLKKNMGLGIRSESDMCYCMFADAVSLVQMGGNYSSQVLIQQMLHNNRLRIRL